MGKKKKNLNGIKYRSIQILLISLVSAKYALQDSVLNFSFAFLQDIHLTIADEYIRHRWNMLFHLSISVVHSSNTVFLLIQIHKGSQCSLYEVLLLQIRLSVIEIVPLTSYGFSESLRYPLFFSFLLQQTLVPILVFLLSYNFELLLFCIQRFETEILIHYYDIYLY